MACDFIEPAIVADTPVNGVAYKHEFARGVWRVVLYSNQICPFSGKPEYVIATKLLMDRQTAQKMIKSLADAFNMRIPVVLHGSNNSAEVRVPQIDSRTTH